ncbi:hypothetical protein FOA43_004706 [Brettanomyces nanus]|uniref:Something about silencing protein 4 domain-containing protein n=1 Tax=Eeniella nana TaxID=13502 RepID=A0A875S8S4_EENNA|nr:uncharacterized protein FOA43_004706 [Brettanomyces nanus]QPG77298.1 hypothetical protein FOA43_004706 [Brettanomyces nanus]
MDDRFSFDQYLSEYIPSHLGIELVAEEEIPKSAKLHTNKELQGIDDDEKLSEEYHLHLVDHNAIGNQHWAKALRRPVKNTPKDVSGWKDPLADSLFSVSHHRKEMDERKFSVADRTRMLCEFDECLNTMSKLGKEVKLKARFTLEEQFERVLKQPLNHKSLIVLSAVLPTITKVEDITNDNELEIKYRTTVKELMKFIIRFEQSKARESVLKKKVRDYNQNRPHTIDTDEDESDDPETLEDLKELRQRRMHRRSLKYGKIIRIHFLDGVTLVIDPISKARIEGN